MYSWYCGIKSVRRTREKMGATGEGRNPLHVCRRCEMSLGKLLRGRVALTCLATCAIAAAASTGQAAMIINADVSAPGDQIYSIQITPGTNDSVVGADTNLGFGSNSSPTAEVVSHAI